MKKKKRLNRTKKVEKKTSGFKKFLRWTIWSFVVIPSLTALFLYHYVGWRPGPSYAEHSTLIFKAKRAEEIACLLDGRQRQPLWLLDRISSKFVFHCEEKDGTAKKVTAPTCNTENLNDCLEEKKPPDK